LRHRAPTALSIAITADEYQDAEQRLVKLHQVQAFPEELAELKAGRAVSRSSKLVNLSPFLANDGLIRIRSRLCESEVQANPIVLAPKGDLVVRIVQSYHDLQNHGGVSSTLAEVRSKFWILRGRQTVRKILNQCMRCRRDKAKPVLQPTGNLPVERVTPSKPFTVIGVDFAGPLVTSANEKCYITLFTCGSTRAVHLELSPTMSACDFQQSFRRLIARRGLCAAVYSDNALTFKRVAADFAPRGVKWNFIPEKAPWMGGFYERLVGTVKRSLKKALGTRVLSYRELETAIIEVEAIVNCRPLTYMTEDPDDCALTPSHFLVGDRLTALPRSNVKIITSSDLQRAYRLRDQALQRFWKIWTKDYLQNLRTAHFSIARSARVLQTGDLVIIFEQSVPRNRWKLGRIKQLYYGKDGIARVARVLVKTDRGKTLLKRAVRHLYPLEAQ